MRCGFLLFYVLLILAGKDLDGAESTRALVTHTPPTPHTGEAVTVMVEGRAGLESAVLEYQVVTPGNYVARADPAFAKDWVGVRMGIKGTDRKIWSAEIPAAVQSHRNLVRYRIRGRAAGGAVQELPPAVEAEPNYAYFVYDGIPPWKAAIDPKSWDPRKNGMVQFGPEVMGQIQTAFLIARIKDVENATWYQQQPDKEYRHTGTFVAEGKVYDHIQFRARGGAWRYAMGKNMWKINFNKGHHLTARDDYGNRYAGKWGKLNLRACIQQGDYGRRGEQGMYEAVGFRLFNLAGVEAPRTHWLSLRIVGEKEENPSNQYRGDFWGLYLAIENEDGDFLEEHGLPDGNLYKMMFGQGELSNQGKGQPSDRSDLQRFLGGMRRANTEAWWRENVDLPRYYSYRSILEAIHHYDVSDGKNYDFYFNPQSSKWCVVPWDIDLTWGDHMYGGGRDPFYAGVTRQPGLKLEYQNRLREIRDLLYNPGETGRLIDECAAIISNPGGGSIVDADRMKWDYHPIMSSRYAMAGKADKGLFYQAVPTGTFEGMVEQMKEYVARRSSYMDSKLLADNSIPATPVIRFTGTAGFATNGLSFKTSAFKGSSGFAALQWRAGQIDKGTVKSRPKRPGHYEITPAWESGELREFRDSIEIPAAALPAGNTYRVRCRMKDEAGKWSHWSEPVEFTTARGRD